MYRAIGVEPTKLIASTSRCSSRRSTATLSPCTTLKHPAGSPAWASNSATNRSTDGSFSLGFRTNVLPQAERVGEHPHRDHRREVERRDAGDDAERLADRVDVDAAGGLLGVVALQQLRDPARVLDVLQAAGDLAHRVGEHLAVLGRRASSPAPCGWRRPSSRRRNITSARLRQRRRPPRRERGPRRGDRRVDLGDRRQADLAGLLAGRRVEHRRRPPRCRLDDPPIDPMRDPIHVASLPLTPGV